MLGPLKERAFAVMHHTGLSARVASSGWRRRRLLILGYHGIARWDEDLWNPALYFSASRFARRLELLRRHRCNVLPLGEAIDRLGRNDLPDRAVVLTFDDGYHDFATIAYPLLRAHGYPATVYLTTLRCEHNFPIVRLLLSYLLWSKREAQLDGSGLPGLVPKRYPLADAKTREAVVDALTAAARESHFDRFDNDEVARQVAGRLGLAYDRYSAMHLLTLLSPEDVAQLANEGVDFQMHSHRHWSPEDPALLARDLRNNRERIERLTGRAAEHFCYPSGVYFTRQLATLSQLGIRTATTCDPGLANADIDPLLLPRFVDTNLVTENTFSSWLNGTAALMSRHTAGARSRNP
jgi:peptidoglycan/xylan/chitin deacetylase (PgdA/CDA1 family)